jgi:hypothetical protein
MLRLRASSAQLPAIACAGLVRVALAISLRLVSPGFLLAVSARQLALRRGNFAIDPCLFSQLGLARPLERRFGSFATLQLALFCGAFACVRQPLPFIGGPLPLLRHEVRNSGWLPVTSTSPLWYQSNNGPTSSWGSAMKPSSDIDACAITFPIGDGSPRSSFRYAGSAAVAEAALLLAASTLRASGVS